MSRHEEVEPTPSQKVEHDLLPDGSPLFGQETKTDDRVFIAVLIAAVFVTLLGIRFVVNYSNERNAAQKASEASRNVLHLEAITNVYECERDGERVLTDRPCGTGVPIRVIRPTERATEPVSKGAIRQ